MLQVSSTVMNMLESDGLHDTVVTCHTDAQLQSSRRCLRHKSCELYAPQNFRAFFRFFSNLTAADAPTHRRHAGGKWPDTKQHNMLVCMPASV